VLMRSRKPCTFFRRRLCGWNVRFTFECPSNHDVRVMKYRWLRVGESNRRRPIGQHAALPSRTDRRRQQFHCAPRTAVVHSDPSADVSLDSLWSRPAPASFLARRASRALQMKVGKVEMSSGHALPDIAFSGRNGVTRNPLRPCYFVDKYVDCAWSGCVHVGAVK
jgi:hypothetical protein